MIINGYGRIGNVPAEDADLARVGLGTPMGELFRRYWQPVAMSSELLDLPKFIKILGEELVVFRDGKGKVGVLDAHCIHRGTSLEYGRIEQDGIRCCYHGWLYDVEGRCLEQPGEPSTSRYKDRIAQPHYPSLEFGGLVFAYMGPPDKQPVFPLYDILQEDGIELFAYRNASRGLVANCNWLQIQENAMDPMHAVFLHSRISGLQFTQIYAAIPRLEFHETPYGMKYVRTVDLPGGRTFIREQELFLLNARALTDNLTRDEPHRERASVIGWWVPVDDTHTIGFHIEASRVLDGQKRTTTFATAKEGRTAGTQEAHADYESTQRNPDDKEAQISQRPIAVHALEHLATSDKGVVMYRRLLRRALAALREGKDPLGVVRDPAQRLIRVSAGNEIFSNDETRDPQTST